MIHTTPTGLHYPDSRYQERDGKQYLITGTHKIMDGQKCVDTIYIVKNERREYREMTGKILFNFFMLKG